MDRKINKQTLYFLVPLASVTLMAFIVLSGSEAGAGSNGDTKMNLRMNGAYKVNHQKHEAPANHEPALISVFKFIVNCNPFKKETSL